MEEPGVASNKRERELARMRAERQAARRAAAAARRRQRNAVIASVVAVVLVVGAVAALVLVRKGDKAKTTASPGTSQSPTPGASASPVAAGPCTYTPDQAAAKPAPVPPAVPPDKGKRVTAVLTTNRGEIDIALDTTKAPCTANSFISLAKAKFYNATPCPRVVTKGIFVLQCGDPTGTGSGGPGYKFADENLAGATYKKGTVAMANGGPGTNGSQFFLVYKDTPLPPQYTPFGTMTKGVDVVAKVAAAGDDGSNQAGGGKPKLPVQITSVTVKAG